MIKPLAGCRHTRFDPTGMEYHHAGNPGCYSSNMTGIPDYVLVIKHLGEAFDDAYVKDLLLLTMYYDFMSYLALTYAQSNRVGLSLLQARTTVVLQLQSLLQLTDLADYQDIIRVMVIIAKQMLPAPPPPPAPPSVRQARVSRFSCAVMSAPPDGYVLSSSSDTSEYEEEEEDDEMSSDHSVPPTHTPCKKSRSGTLNHEESLSPCTIISCRQKNITSVYPQEATVSADWVTQTETAQPSADSLRSLYNGSSVPTATRQSESIQHISSGHGPQQES
jgi:hypothetical protein